MGKYFKNTMTMTIIIIKIFPYYLFYDIDYLNSKQQRIYNINKDN